MKLCYGLALAILFTAHVYGAATDNTSKDNAFLKNGHEEIKEEQTSDILTQITHITKEKDVIDISLSKESYTETCFVQPPNSEMVKADTLKMDGVIIQEGSSFVSCRISVGPMSNELLGLWNLCGKSDDGTSRCQPVEIRWNNEAHPTTTWMSSTHEKVDHPVHYSGSVNTGIADNGPVTTCHIITPAGEDLVITVESNYPHIERVLDNPAVCSIIIKDITAELLGDWIIYGRFSTIFGQSENRLPLTLYLYDESNPYDQAYNVTILKDEQHLVNAGTEITIGVSQTGVVEDCICKAPSGKTFNLNDQPSELNGISLRRSDTEALCQLSLNPITEELAGEWEVIGKFSNELFYHEVHQTFNIIIEDPANPIKEEVSRTIQLLPSQEVVISSTTKHNIIIEYDVIRRNEYCFIITPDGLQYTFIPGFNVPGIEIIYDDAVECGVTVTLTNYDMIGEWTLVSRAMMLSIPVERRQPFKIQVEEAFVIQDDINISKGADLYIHLYDVEMPSSCKLYGPDGNEYMNYEVDPKFSASCGYIVRRVDHSHNGTWTIAYANDIGIPFMGRVDVYVLDSDEVYFEVPKWTVGDSVNTTLGPEDATYCKIEDSQRRTLFDDFGQCQIVLDRVTFDHSGTWKIFIGMPGKVLLEEYEFYVDVLARAEKPVVTTAIARIAPSVMLTCSIPIEHEVHACKFRDARGNILIAAHGVGEDGYMFNGSTINYDTEVHTNDCTLRLTNPTVLDLGIWRCAMDTNTSTYYGFLTVTCPYLMRDPEVAASIVTEPVLEAETSLSYLEDEPVVLSCSIPTEIRYCYFRTRNGTVFNVFPGMSASENFEYAGAGLDAGDCGIRFKSLSAAESGAWSCHVGLVNVNAEEQRADITVNVQARITVRHFWHETEPLLFVEAVVYDQQPIEYCRFVKITGQGFTSENVPDRYRILDGLQRGTCILEIRNSDIIDAHPWTIAAKLVGRDGEFSGMTTDNVFILPSLPSDEDDHNDDHNDDHQSGGTSQSSGILFWTLVISVSLIPVLIAAIFIPKKNREWTYRRASRVRVSFRQSWNNSFKKKPIAVQGA